MLPVPRLCRLPFHAIIPADSGLWFGLRRVSHILLFMPAKSELVVISRGDSDLDRVFPSGVRVGKTPYGLGVYAFAFIPKGTPIARVSGQVIRDPNYGSDYCIDAGDGKVLEPAPPFCYLNHSCEPNCQLMQYVREEDADEAENLETGELTEEEMDFEGDCEYTDHDGIYGGVEDDVLAEQADNTVEESDESETESQLFEDDAEIWVESVRDIMPNDELTIDYAWPADRAVKCLCGKPKCRGWIVDPAERKLLPRK